MYRGGVVLFSPPTPENSSLIVIILIFCDVESISPLIPSHVSMKVHSVPSGRVLWLLHFEIIISVGVHRRGEVNLRAWNPKNPTGQAGFVQHL